MNGYVAINREAMFETLRLPAAATKVIAYLATRANEFGVCFPSVKMIAEGCFMSVASVYRGLDILYQRDLVHLVRSGGRDLLTGVPIPNVYVVSNVYLPIRDENMAQHLTLWAMGQNGSERRDDSHKRYTNKQQQQTTQVTTEPTTQVTTEPTTTTNNRNAYGEHQNDFTNPEAVVDFVERESTDFSDAPPLKKTASKQKMPTPVCTSAGNAKRMTCNDAPVPTHNKNAPPNSAPPPSTSPFAPSVSRYKNPDLIHEELEAADDETLAKDLLFRYQIPMALARGLVVQYSAERVRLADSVTVLNMQKGKSHSPAGFFRMMLQKNLADFELERSVKGKPVSLDDGRRFTSGKYADYIES